MDQNGNSRREQMRGGSGNSNRQEHMEGDSGNNSRQEQMREISGNNSRRSRLIGRRDVDTGMTVWVIGLLFASMSASGGWTRRVLIGL